MEKSPEQLLRESAERNEMRDIVGFPTLRAVNNQILEMFGYPKRVPTNPQTYQDKGEGL